MISTRRPIILLGLMLVAAAVSPAAATARHGGAYRHFSAVESGSTVLTPAGPGLFKSTSEASLRGTYIGNGTLHLDATVKIGAGGKLAVAGRFKMTAANGDTLRGTYTGNLTIAGPVTPLVFFSKVKGGTGRFAGARGRLVTEGSSTISAVDPTGSIHTLDRATCKGWIRF
jgi:hypothetical protein